MNIKEIFGTHYLSYEEYQDIFRELYDEFGDLKVNLSIDHNFIFTPNGENESYFIDKDLYSKLRFKNYLDTNQPYRIFKRTQIILSIFGLPKPIRLDTIKDTLLIKSQLIDTITFCLNRINVDPSHVSVVENTNHYPNLEFKILRRKELSEVEENLLLNQL